MGEAKHGRNAQVPRALRNAGTARPTGLPIFGLKAVGKVEQVTEDGQKVEALLFRLVMHDGAELVQQTVDGDMPVEIMAIPRVIGQSLLVPTSRIAHV